MNEVDKKVDKLPNAPVSVREQNQPISAQPKKKNNKNNIILAAIVILALAYLGRNDIANLADIDLFPEETTETIPDPADIQLYTFSDPYDNDSVNVEFWLLNIGEELATEIEVYVRVRDHNGTILFSEIVDTTTLLLRGNETCSGYYEIPITNNTTAIYHTIEINWMDGRTSYSKTTLI